MVTSLLAARGLRVGTYTSPNLSRVNERIARNGEPIDDEAFTDVLDSLARIEGLMDEPPTRFELLTAAALTWFADEAVDVAVVEVGLGGTWDCTNIVHAAVAVVTNISYDHTEVLGPTLEDIARDKAGHLHLRLHGRGGGDRPHAGGPLPRRRPTAAGAEAFWARGIDFACTSNRLAVGGRLVDLRTPGARLRRAARPAARQPPGRQRGLRPGRRRGVLRRPAPRGRGGGGVRRRAGARAARGRSAATRWCWSTGPTTRPA